LLADFKTNPQVELIKFQAKLGTIPDLKNVLSIKDGQWLVPASRAVEILLKNKDAVKFDTFKRLIA
jgi:hypothetical protein